jgi:hypothetical protein
MIRPRLCAALMFCGLLAFATSAAAECAWVLWSNVGSISAVTSRPDGMVDLAWTFHRDWSVSTAYETKGECDNAQKWYREQYPTKSPAVGMEIRDYKCLPDTVDPRGPKGR